MEKQLSKTQQHLLDEWKKSEKEYNEFFYKLERAEKELKDAQIKVSSFKHYKEEAEKSMKYFQELLNESGLETHEF